MGKGRTALTDSMRRSRGRPAKRKPESVPGLSAPVELPSCPEQLGAAAADEWQRLAPYLLTSRRTAAIDRQSFTSYCVAFGYWQEAARSLLRNHWYDPISGSRLWRHNAGGKPKPLKMTDIFLWYGSAVLISAAKFGLTARTRHLDHADSGRPALPDELHEVRGNPSKKKLRAKFAETLSAESDAMLPPAGVLDDESMQEFDRLASQLGVLDLFTALDIAPLAVAAGTWGLSVMAMQELNDDTMELPSKDEAVEHPCSVIWRKSQILLAESWKEYGMSPVDRKRFKTDSGKKTGGWKPKVYLGGAG